MVVDKIINAQYSFHKDVLCRSVLTIFVIIVIVGGRLSRKCIWLPVSVWLYQSTISFDFSELSNGWSTAMIGGLRFFLILMVCMLPGIVINIGSSDTLSEYRAKEPAHQKSESGAANDNNHDTDENNQDGDNCDGSPLFNFLNFRVLHLFVYLFLHLLL